jgi:hypothetical protein
MKSYKEPSFQDRTARAAEAKQKALDQLRSKPPVDARILAERQAARLQRDAAEGERRAARKAAAQAAKDAKEAEAKRAATPVPQTEAEKKLARDARYAARKNRK